MNAELEQRPAVKIYKALERHYYKFTAHAADTDLSLQIINLLLPLYQQDVTAVINRLDSYVKSHEQMLHDIVLVQEEYATTALIFQPEALMISDLLECDQLALRQLWNQRFPEQELERLSVALGHSFD